MTKTFLKNKEWCDTAYYKQVEHGIHKWQRNLIYATAAELRKKIVGYE